MQLQTIGITGGSGFIGTHLTSLLLENGYRVVIFTRSSKQSNSKNLIYAHWDAERSECDVAILSSVDAMVHLAGASIADKRWSEKRKNDILNSRVIGIRFLVSQLKQHAPNCKTFISASAIGYYGPDYEKSGAFSEDRPAYHDFIGDVCIAWENVANTARAFMRTVILRFGIVLGTDGGAYPKFIQAVKFGLVPILGSGKEVSSWIHISDHCRLILFVLENKAVEGVFNAVAPYPVSNEELMKTIAKTRGGIHISFHIPAFILKIMLGEMSTEILKSCTVSPGKILRAGFTFQYPQIEGAVRELIRG